MLMQLEDDEDWLGSGGKLFGRSDRYNFMCALKAEFFLETFGQHNTTKHALRRGIKIVRLWEFRCGSESPGPGHCGSEEDLLPRRETQKRRWNRGVCTGGLILSCYTPPGSSVKKWLAWRARWPDWSGCGGNLLPGRISPFSEGDVMEQQLMTKLDDPDALPQPWGNTSRSINGSAISMSCSINCGVISNAISTRPSPPRIIDWHMLWRQTITSRSSSVTKKPP